MLLIGTFLSIKEPLLCPYEQQSILELVKGYNKRTGLSQKDWVDQFLLSVFLFELTVPYSTISIQGLQESVWFIQNFLLTVYVFSI